MTTIPRRTLAGAAGLLLAAAAAPAKAATLDGELLHLVGEFVTFIAAERATLAAMTPEEQQAHYHARGVDPSRGVVSPINAMAGAIARIAAKTPEGVQAKARALLWFHGGTDAGLPYAALGDGLFESVIADMTGTPIRFLSRPSAPEVSPSVLSARLAPAAASANLNPDAPLIAWCAAFNAHRDTIRAAYKAAPDDDWDEADAIANRVEREQRPLLALICANPPTTMEGLRAVAGSLVQAMPELDPLREDRSGDDESRLQVTLLRGLLVGGAA